MWTFAQKIARRAPALPARAPAQPANTNPVRNILRGPTVQPKLKIGATNDPAEAEADRVADRFMRMSPPGGGEGAAMPPSSPRPGPNPIRRMCDECEGELKRKEKPGIKGTPPQISSLGLGQGAPLTASERSFFEPRFGRDLSHVRIHSGAAADQSARSINARAYTLGRDIAFASGEYTPGTGAGRRLMAHELAHVYQAGYDGVSRSPIIRRVTHGPGTPTNCHNWKIPLPPWIAGIYAHAQAAFYFAMNPGATGRIYPEVTMPRGTKMLMGVPNPPAITPPGFVDLVGIAPGLAQFGEIKSTYSAALATPQAAHYFLRHTEWLTRAPHTGGLDAAYFGVLGGLPVGALMNGLASVTGSGIPVGPFMGDPLKTLWLEADAAGAIVYWCTGIGTVNPAWAILFKEVFKRIMDAFWDAYRTIVEGIEAIGDWIWAHPALAFVLLVMLAIIGYALAVIGGLLEAPTFGGSTPLTIGGFTLGLTATIALLTILGIDTTGFEEAGDNLVAAADTGATGSAQGADYERDADRGRWRTADTTTTTDQFSRGLTGMQTATAALPNLLTGRALDLINPLSDSPPLPSLNTLRGQVAQAGPRLAASPDPRVAEIGGFIQRGAARV